jgi:hypothetical protein
MSFNGAFMISLLPRPMGVFVLLSSLIFISGCGGNSAGPKVGSMTGQITYKGVPLNSGYVQVYGEDGRGGSGPITAEGVYTVGDAPLGNITITVHAIASAMSKMNSTARPPGTPAMPGESNNPPVTIPSKYSDKAKSGLTFTIKSGTQTNNINLN